MMARGALCVGLVLACGLPLPAGAELSEQVFPVLQIGTRTYTNVTITTRAKDYIFILHSAGMANVKLSELSPELRDQLGYAPAKPKQTNNVATVLAKQTLARLDAPEVKKFEDQLNERLTAIHPDVAPLGRLSDPRVLLGILGFLVVWYLLVCACFHLICSKANHPGGVMVWLPVLQVFPLLRAAGMSGWWFLALFVPLLNIVAYVLWCFKIVEARGKHVVWAILLILPVTDGLAFLYLALSSAAGVAKTDRKDSRRIELMTLETV
jgi:hypothetical protein